MVFFLVLLISQIEKKMYLRLANSEKNSKSDEKKSFNLTAKSKLTKILSKAGKK